MPIFKVEIVERSYSTITKYVYADSKEQVETVYDSDWGEVPNYWVDENTLDSGIEEILLVDDTSLIELLEGTNEVHDLPHQHGDWVVSESCGAWICVKGGLCGAHFTYQGKDKEPGPMLARCYCGWAADGGDGRQQLVEMGENVEDDY